MSEPDLDTRLETYYVRVRGTVQGVGFRHATVRQAHALRIRGYVANREDGSVESEERTTEKRYERFEQH